MRPDSGANGGGRTPFASSCVVGRRHRSLFSLERMRAITSLLVVSGFLFLNGHLHGQVYATNTSGKVFTNRIGQAQAFQLASRLKVGMREEEANQYLERNGLGWSISAGSSFGWFNNFQLTNGCSLILDIKPKKFRADGEWRDGLLQAAFIYSNSVQIADIRLANAP